ncbi:unnamed protein product [Gongylonema pulchrum]|uniref:Col_cuticle_N domain-containing protein n=1 Tax=Gongylonema pulchrum TaxID=637853 RepID=A0A183D2W3_9BILA|nr:unnamed protein product [Gongylonema pulchrum]
MSASDDPKLRLAEAESLKRVAFFGIAVSTIATLTAIIVIPMVYNYMQHVQSSLQVEIDFCKHRTNGLWEQFAHVEEVSGVRDRPRRSIYYRRTGFSSGRMPHTQARAAQMYDEGPSAGFAGASTKYGGRPKSGAPRSGVGAASFGGFPGNYHQTAEVRGAPAHTQPEGRTGAANYGAGGVSEGMCCSCQVGPAGPPGAPGIDGKNGVLSMFF